MRNAIIRAGVVAALTVTTAGFAVADHGFPIVMAQFWLLRNYALFHNEF